MRFMERTACDLSYVAKRNPGSSSSGECVGLSSLDSRKHLAQQCHSIRRLIMRRGWPSLDGHHLAIMGYAQKGNMASSKERVVCAKHLSLAAIYILLLSINYHIIMAERGDSVQAP
jgi:hypothetical protein